MSSPPQIDFDIAESLEGVQLANGWLVVRRLSDSATGGNFGVPYLVERQHGSKREQAFLKALNLSRLRNSADFASDLQRHVSAFNFEKDTLRLCAQKRLKRVATLLDAGQHLLPSNPLPICYIIFELANGDVRGHLANLAMFDLAWTLRTLNQVSVALKQLHTNGVAHQDIKPSNILMFDAFGAKLGDLGCADTNSDADKSPRGIWTIAGDPAYAPPELRYSEVSTDWNTRRRGCDLFLLGNLVVFFFTGGLSMSAVIRQKTHSSHQPANWTHGYRAVLPYINAAFEDSLVEIAKSIPSVVRVEITEILRWLCNPDPKRRGHPKDLTGSQFNLERIISKFHELALKAEMGRLGT